MQHLQTGYQFTKPLLLTLVLFLALPAAATADSIKIGELEIEQPVIRATVPNAKVAGGFVIIKNKSAAADRLISGSANFAGRVEIHEMKVVDDIMKMRKMSDGLEIPAGGMVHLKPSGYHIMFMKLTGQMRKGEKQNVKLVFQDAGEIDVSFDVQSIAKTMAHGKMGHGKMDHSKMKKKSN